MILGEVFLERILKTIFNYRQNTFIVLDFKKHIIRFTFISYFLFLIYKLLLGAQRLSSREILIANRDVYLNLVPFKTISRYFEYFSYFKLWDWISNIFGNVLLFIPIGLLIPFMIKRNHKGLITLVIGFFMTLNIEVIQHFFGLGVFDVDDILLNILGVALGYVLYKAMKAFMKE